MRLPSKAMTMVIAAFAMALSAASGYAEPDAKNGETLYNRCKGCHSVTVGPKKMGPHLQGIFGRTVGSVEDYSYSKSMAAGNFEWDHEAMKLLLTKPKDLVPGTKMISVIIRDENDLTDLIAYLEEVTQVEKCDIAEQVNE